MNNMALYFGTDGIRGVANQQLTPDLATRCGNALAQMGGKKVLVGRDTRVSGDMLVCSLASGLTAGGCDVVDVGVLPTPAISYLTKKYGCDFGVVISASHNPPEYNGIKIFDNNGIKLCDQKEQIAEGFMASMHLAPSDKTGRYIHKDGLNDYCTFLQNCTNASLRGLKIALDCSNGATGVTAKRVFEKLGAKVFAFFAHTDGRQINCGCGATNPRFLANKVKQLGCNVGFCFDGDGDRVVAIDENGCVVDGDKILYILAKHKLEQNKLEPKVVAGTFYTNVGVENALKKLGITLLRCDVGDKYVSNLMRSKNLLLGGEQSGHIVMSEFLSTGDGTLVSLQLSKLLFNQPLSKLAEVSVFAQVGLDVVTKDKMQVINNQKLWQVVTEQSEGFDGRILVRASGTEPKVRILVESVDQNEAKKVANIIAKVIENIAICVE